MYKATIGYEPEPDLTGQLLVFVIRLLPETLAYRVFGPTLLAGR